MDSMECQAKELSSKQNTETTVTSDPNCAPTPHELLGLAPAIEAPTAATAAVKMTSSLSAPSSPRQPPPITFVTALNLQPNTERATDVTSSAGLLLLHSLSLSNSIIIVIIIVSFRKLV